MAMNLHSRNLQDVLTGAVFVASGVAFALHAVADALTQVPGWGAAWLTVGLSLLLCLMGGLLMFKSIAIEADRGDGASPVVLRPVLGVLLAGALFALLAPRAGMVAASAALVAVCAQVSSRLGWTRTFGLALACAVAVWAVFTLWPHPNVALWGPWGR